MQWSSGGTRFEKIQHERGGYLGDFSTRIMPGAFNQLEATADAQRSVDPHYKQQKIPEVFLRAEQVLDLGDLFLVADRLNEIHGL